jgi:hypothetical protein
MMAAVRSTAQARDMRCFSSFCIGIAVCWWAVVHNDTAARVFVVLLAWCHFPAGHEHVAMGLVNDVEL